MIALPLFALGAASILGGLALMRMQGVLKGNQQVDDTKWSSA